MNNEDGQESEKHIAKYFARLPRRNFSHPDKQTIWLRIRNHILETELAREKSRASHGFVFDFLSLRNNLGKAFATVLIVLSTLSVVAGAARAMPGDTLYALKKYSEKVEIALANSPEKEAEVRVKVLERRVAEVKYLVAENKEPAIVAKTVSALRRATEEVVAIVEQEPDLKQQKEQVINLAIEQEKVLTSVNNDIKQELGEVVSDAISGIQASLAKLQNALPGDQEEVKGLTVDPDNASSTSIVAKPGASKKASSVPPGEAIPGGDGIIDSGIQIDAVIRLMPDDENPDPEPSIVSQPRN